MTSPKATARGLWLLSSNTYTYQEFDGVTRWMRRCQESIGLNNKAEVLEGAIQVFEIERFLQVDI
jgi:hypothetical protein